MSGPTGFEQAVKEALEPYEVPYNSADWSHLERALDGRTDDVARVSRSGLYALLIGGSLAAVSSFLILTAPDLPAVNEPLAENTTLPPAHVATTANAANDGAEDVQQPTTEVPLKEAVRVPVEQETAAHEPQRSEITSSTAAAVPVKPTPIHPMSHEPVVKPSITEGCPGSVIDFEAENVSGEGMYLWNFGDGSFSNKPKPSHVFSKSGSFEVMLSHSTSDGGGIRNKAVADRIVIHEAPEASFNVLKQEYDNTVPSIHFENRSLGGQSYLWDFGDGSTSTIAHPDHIYKKAGVYTVNLAVVNGNGCEDRAERTVRIENDYNLDAPGTFSPNGDGTDDVFIPEALKTLGARFVLTVMESKTGVVVYETNDPQRPWNGKIANKGDACPQGEYVWMVEMKDGEKLGGTYTGSIQLVR
ncbi:MAG: PKD domain-containing protein [Flavobacteriales bacterium]